MKTRSVANREEEVERKKAKLLDSSEESPSLIKQMPAELVWELL